jgi:hypothetical protein
MEFSDAPLLSINWPGPSSDETGWDKQMARYVLNLTVVVAGLFWIGTDAVILQMILEPQTPSSLSMLLPGVLIVPLLIAFVSSKLVLKRPTTIAIRQCFFFTIFVGLVGTLVFSVGLMPIFIGLHQQAVQGD